MERLLYAAVDSLEFGRDNIVQCFLESITEKILFSNVIVILLEKPVILAIYNGKSLIYIKNIVGLRGEPLGGHFC